MYMCIYMYMVVNTVQTNTVHCFNVSLCHYVVIEEQNVRLKLTVTDTPGFGDQINNEKWYVICLMRYMRPLHM